MSIYLFLYNFIQLCGWSFFFFRGVLNLINFNSLQEMYSNTYIILECCQYGAFLEIIHSITGIVKTSILSTSIQIIGRISIVLLLQFVPVEISYGYLIIFFAWSSIEIVRYSYYILNLIKKNYSNFNIPYLLIWCRYTFFIVLYPIGSFGEMLIIYNAQKYFNKIILWKNNAFNIYVGNLFYPIYILFLPSLIFMYGYLFKQRKKVFNRLNNNIKMKKNE